RASQRDFVGPSGNVRNRSRAGAFRPPRVGAATRVASWDAVLVVCLAEARRAVSAPLDRLRGRADSGTGRRPATLSRLGWASVQTLSPQNRILGVLGAVEAGVALWYFTNGRWVSGIIFTIAIAYLVAVYLRRERKVKGHGGGRRY